MWTESSLNPETRLSHALSLSGIESDTRLIYVRRFLDKSETTNTYTSGMYGCVYLSAFVNIHYYYLISETRINEPITIQQQIKDTTCQLDSATINKGSLYMYMCIFINSLYHNDLVTSNKFSIIFLHP